MPDTHVWITGAPRAACVAAAAAFAPDASVDCHRRLRGPYTGTGSLLRTLVPGVHARTPALPARHAIEIVAVAPELEVLVGAAPATLTSLALQAERTRWYSHFRTRRIAHGIVDFLRECARDHRLTLAFGAVDHADPTDLEFLAIALRRLDPAQVSLLVCSHGAVGQIEAELTARCQRQLVTGADRDGDATGHGCPGGDVGVADARTGAGAAAIGTAAAAAGEAAAGGEAGAAFIASDGTSDIPAEREAYLLMDPQVRARLHDERAAELGRRGEWSLRLGAIPYHLENGVAPRSAGRAACVAALDYCIGSALYEAGLDLATRLSALVDADAEPIEYYRAQTLKADCQVLLERPDETEPIYYDLLSRSAKPYRHMVLSYTLAMLYTRMYGPEHKDHRRALAHVNTAIAIASQLEDPAERAFNTVFMNNGKALVEMHLGNLEESLRLVTEGVERLDRELPPGRHLLHRSVLRHNRGQVLAALGRHGEALAEFDHAIEVDPNYPEYRFDRGNLLFRMGRHARALADYEAAIPLGPPFPELYYNCGDLRAATGDLDGAMRDLSYVLDLEPDHLEARVTLASLLLDAGDPAAAAAQAREGVAVLPDEARLHCTLGLALLELHDYQAARGAFDRAIEIDPGLSAAWSNRAVAAYEQGRYDDAVADLSAALDADPGNPDLLYNRGFAHEAAGRPRAAIGDYTLARQHPGADQAALAHGRDRCLAALGRAEDQQAEPAAPR